MLNFNFPEKDLGLVSPPHFVYDFLRIMLSCYIILTGQIALSGYLYFARYWEICVLQLFVNQPVVS